MSVLPRSWSTSDLEELCISVSDGDHQAPPKAPTGVPFITISSIRNGRIDLESASRFVPHAYKEALESSRDPQAGDIVLSVTGSIGRAAIVEDSSFVFQRHIALIKTASLIERKYLYYFLTSPSTGRHLKDLATGTAQKTLPLSKLRTLSVPLPPLAEQERIVAKLDSLNARSARASTDLARIDVLVARYKQAVLSKAFSGELTREWRHGGEWPISVQLSDVAGSFTYGSAAKSQKIGAVPVLRMGNIQEGKLDWADLVYTDDKDEIAKYRLSPGDVLFNRTNSPALVGKTALYNGEREAIFAGYLIRIVSGPRLDARYLTYALNSPSGREFSWNAKTDGVSQSNISASKLKEFALAVPQLEEQHEIVRRIDSAFASIDRLAKEAKRALELVTRLDEAILAKAFRGELVPQDENDEPASLLLERIRQARTLELPRPKRRASATKGKVHHMARTIIEALAEAKDWLEAQELFARCGVRDGSSTEDIEKLYRQLLDLERQDKVEIEEVADPVTGAKQGNRVRLRKSI